MSIPPSVEAKTVILSEARSTSRPKYNSLAISWPASMMTSLTGCPFASVCGVIRLVPRRLSLASIASLIFLQTMTPPPLPLPPA